MVFSGKFQYLGLAVLAVVLCSADVATAQRGGFGGSNESVMGLAQTEHGAKVIEANEDQIAGIKELTEQMNLDRRDMFMEMRDEWRAEGVDQQALMEKVRDKMASIENDAQKELESILLPHQMTRLKEMSLQLSMKRDPKQALTKIADAIGATEEDVEAYVKKLEELAPEVKRKQLKLQQQANETAMKSAFTSAQIAKFKKLIGESYAAPERQPFRGWGQQRGGDRSDRGGRGGDRGDRGGDRGDRRGGDRRGGDKGNDF